MIINNLAKDFRDITAVELFKEFSDFISGQNITIYNEDLLKFRIDKRIRSFNYVWGIAHYFNEQESLSIFKNVYFMLERNGVFILKNQFGVNETKNVHGSEKRLVVITLLNIDLLILKFFRLESIGFKK